MAGSHVEAVLSELAVLSNLALWSAKLVLAALAVLSDSVLCSDLLVPRTNTYIGTIVLHIQDKHQRCVAPATENRIRGTAAPVQICISAKNTPPADA
ncbi:hypothetical protein PC116_g10229 [Phytophthora cactorum]|uniref:Uncharacterized protein n=1 Tax=Phytophthora cactorum TaxID=29920 RepID=A0A8T1KXT3_9STRA|nr:hypothetical protein PC111_g6064 [Phytophthora cactorum]KAG2988809.1 hypothetical protein PC118_g6493 [Phytophthora cactorum]KAG4241834.1 hypothetical protein PC116_g10229 [Phytophthora cactorum]